MQILPPVLERELRVGARRRGTYWMRVGVGIVATLVGAWLHLTSQFNPYVGPQAISRSLFSTLAILAGIYCALAGLRTTADCVSREKRDGTLGLLFLTDLKGYDVVAGKMLATSLGSFYGLAAMFPVMALPLLLGGVPAQVFWYMTALLVNVLFLSLACGMFMSVLCRQEMRAVGTTFLMVLLFTAGIPFLGLVGADLWYRLTTPGASPALFSRGAPEFTAWFSPVYAFSELMNALYNNKIGQGFWYSMIAIHGSAWLLLLLSSLRIPFSWQDRALSTRSVKLRTRLARFTHGSGIERGRFRRVLLDRNAYFWLAARNRAKPWAVWSVLAATGLFWLWGWMKWPRDFTEGFVFVLMALWLHSVLKLWIASEASQRLADDRQSGALELLLSTPLSVRQILSGQWLALRRQFFGPLITVLALDLFLAVNLERSDSEWLPTWLAGMIVLVADAITVAWVGAWLGLKTRNASKALAGTVGRILILPWIAFLLFLTFVSMVSLGRAGFRWSYTEVVTLWVVICLLFNLFFALSARKNLLDRLRDLATQRGEMKRRWWWPFRGGRMVVPPPPMPPA